MRTLKQAELNEVLELHMKWINNDSEGIQANLMNCNLKGVNLKGVDLQGANLQGANLQGSILSGANLSGADLSGANLRDANLEFTDLICTDFRDASLNYVDFRGSNLERANLKGAILNYTVGDMVFIKSMVCDKYQISYTSEMMYIGCKSHLIEEWRNFTDEEIEDMDDGALEWWAKWK